MTWFNHNGIPARIFLPLDTLDDNGTLLFGSSPDVRFPTSVYQADYGFMDHTLQIPWRWSPPYNDFKSPHAIKQFERLILDFENYNGGVTVDWEVEGGVRSGSFVANIPTQNVWGNDTDKIIKMWNNDSGTSVNGLYWARSARKPMVYRLPSTCRGRDLKIELSVTDTGNDPPILNEFGVQFYTIREMYPGKARST